MFDILKTTIKLNSIVIIKCTHKKFFFEKSFVLKKVKFLRKIVRTFNKIEKIKLSLLNFFKKKKIP